MDFCFFVFFWGKWGSGGRWRERERERDRDRVLLVVYQDGCLFCLFVFFFENLVVLV